MRKKTKATTEKQKKTLMKETKAALVASLLDWKARSDARDKALADTTADLKKAQRKVYELEKARGAFLPPPSPSSACAPEPTQDKLMQAALGAMYGSGSPLDVARRFFVLSTFASEFSIISFAIGAMDAGAALRKCAWVEYDADEERWWFNINNIERALANSSRVVKSGERKCSRCGGTGNDFSASVSAYYSTPCNRCAGLGIVSVRQDGAQQLHRHLRGTDSAELENLRGRVDGLEQALRIVMVAKA